MTTTLLAELTRTSTSVPLASLPTTSTGEAVQFWVLGAVALIGALGVVFATKAVYSAIFLATTMIILAIFLMGLVIALGTYFAVIYMADHPIDIENFEVTALDNVWKAGSDYEAGAYVKHEESYYQAKSAHTAGESFDVNSTIEGGGSSFWIKVEGIPHKISWKVNQADLIEINSRKPGNPFFHMYQPEDTEKVQGTVIRVLAKAATSSDFRLKARSEAFWGETE